MPVAMEIVGPTTLGLLSLSRIQAPTESCSSVYKPPAVSDVNNGALIAVSCASGINNGLRELDGYGCRVTPLS